MYGLLMRRFRSVFVSQEFMNRSAELLREGLIRPGTTEEHIRYGFRLPLLNGSIISFGSIEASPSHVGRLSNSVDFYCHEGSPVLAVADGIVGKVRYDKNVHGNSIEYWDGGNFIELLHPQIRHTYNGAEYEVHTWYEHLKFDGSIVVPGQKVYKGQVIGHSGNTGFSENPHLHFQAHIMLGDEETDIMTLRAEFTRFQPVYEHYGLMSLLR